MFVPRLTAPSTTDPNWIVQSAGGKNPCIPITGVSVLPNCFSGDTKIVTREGIVRLDAIVGKTVDVLTDDGTYHTATGVYGGVQPVYKLTFENKSEYICTASHEWSVISKSHRNGKSYIKKKVIKSIDLNKHHNIPYAQIQSDTVSQKSKNGIYTRIKSIEPLNNSIDVYCVSEPVTHTFTLADGLITRNCTGYTVGRSLELYGDDAYALPWQENAGMYYSKLKESTIWKRSSKPTPGCIACYSRAGEAGHVAIVEQVNADNSIVTSESAWGGSRFYTQTLRPPYYTWSSAYVLQGFIYNTKGPTGSSSKIEGFIKAAKDCIGKTSKKLNIGRDGTCSAAFVVYCANKVSDLVGKVIPDKKVASEFTQAGVTKSMGSYVIGPIYGKDTVPEPGDIMLIRDKQNKKYTTSSDCDALGIVVEANNSLAYVVKLNPDGKVIQDSYRVSSKLISGYYRPKWGLLQNNTMYMVGYAPLGEFYDTKNTAEDATVREVGYIDSSNKPTIKKSGISLSVVNYTTMLSSVMDGLLVPCAVSSNIEGTAVLDGVTNSKARECIQYLMGKGLNAAAACGICGNIEAESSFNTAALGDFSNGVPSAFGICQWRFNRAVGMKQVAGANWSNNLTGQLDYLWTELQQSFNNTVLKPIMQVANTEQGARTAADIFVRKFEIPFDPDGESQKRQEVAVKYFNQLVIQMSTTVTGSSTITTGSAFSGKTIDIPSWVPQAPINDIYTNYTYFYPIWGRSTRQYQVAQIWNAKGRKSNRNIATIDGMYLIALKTTFGYSGDKVSVILDNGTVINCIIADSKGNENAGDSFAAYGHNMSGRANVVEWEAIGPANSHYISQQMDLSGWRGHTVSKIINGGSIL